MKEVTIREFIKVVNDKKNLRVILENDFLSMQSNKVLNLECRIGKILINDWEVNIKNCKILTVEKEYIITDDYSNTKLIVYPSV
ncbi:hypothetical protein FOR95_28620 [Bacillus anthracis]|nr:hypothetical protein [Bacillus anthracis]